MYVSVSHVKKQTVCLTAMTSPRLTRPLILQRAGAGGGSKTLTLSPSDVALLQAGHAVVPKGSTSAQQLYQQQLGGVRAVSPQQTNSLLGPKTAQQLLQQQQQQQAANQQLLQQHLANQQLTSRTTANPQGGQQHVANQQLYSRPSANPQVVQQHVANQQLASGQTANSQVGQQHVANHHLGSRQSANPQVIHQHVANQHLASRPTANPHTIQLGQQQLLVQQQLIPDSLPPGQLATVKTSQVNYTLVLICICRYTVKHRYFKLICNY